MDIALQQLKNGKAEGYYVNDLPTAVKEVDVNLLIYMLMTQSYITVTPTLNNQRFFFRVLSHSFLSGLLLTN